MNRFKNLISKSILVFCMVLIFGVLSNNNVFAANTLQPTHKYTFDTDNGNTVIDTGSLAGTSGKYNGTANIAQIKSENGQTYRSFNGTSDYISFSNYVIPTGKKTMKFYIKRNGNPSQLECILSNAKSLSTNNGWDIFVDKNGYICIDSMKGDSGKNRVVITSNKNVCDNTWHLVMFKWDGTINLNSAKLYVDDMINPDASATANAEETVDPVYGLCLGRLSSENDLYSFKGDLDNIEIYNDVVEYEVKPTAISLNKTALDLPVDGIYSLIATITPDNATNKKITWTSDKPDIVTVDSTGKVAAIKEGTATITITTVDGSKTATCIVTVKKVPVAATSITLNKSTDSLTVDEWHQLTAIIAPTDATTSNIIWTSSDSSTVSVDETTGKITGVKVGTAIITATVKDTNISTTCAITVKPKDTIPTNPTDNTGNAVLTITMTNGNVKAYTVSMSKVNDFISWYDNRVSGSAGKAYYIFDKSDSTQTTFTKKTEYIVFDKISSYEVDAYSK